MEFLKYVRCQWDRVASWVLLGAGLIALLVGWIGASSTVFVSEQIPYLISGGLLGVFLLGVGSLLWLSADLRDEWRKLDAIERRMAAAGPDPGKAERNGHGPVSEPAPAGRPGDRGVPERPGDRGVPERTEQPVGND
ncbi:MAG: hypothetical protein ACRD0O_08220 [Acidimicrobiia bacterium]